jgi:hypothetical protein
MEAYLAKPKMSSSERFVDEAQYFRRKTGKASVGLASFGTAL